MKLYSIKMCLVNSSELVNNKYHNKIILYDLIILVGGALPVRRSGGMRNSAEGWTVLVRGLNWSTDSE